MAQEGPRGMEEDVFFGVGVDGDGPTITEPPLGEWIPSGKLT